MDRAIRLPAAEQGGQEVERGMEQRQAGQGEQHEADRRDPVIDPRPGRIAVDPNRIAGMHGISRLDVLMHGGHVALPPASSLARCSSSPETRLAPLTRWCRKPNAAIAAMAVRPAYLVRPFHRSTIGL